MSSCRPATTTIFAAGALAVLLSAAPALARLALPVKVQPVGPPRAAQAGQPYEGRVELRTDGTVALSGFRLEGSGWTTLGFRAPASISPAPDEVTTIAYTCVATDVSAPLFLVFDANGREQRRRLDIAPGSVDRLHRRDTVLSSVSIADGARSGDGLRNPAPRHAPPSTNLEKNSAGVAPPDGGVRVNARDIRVRGSFVYTRPDNVTLGADGVTARVYDEDDPFADELLAQVVLGPDGEFDVTFRWDPCWSCDDRPDLYVEFEAANDHVVVESAFWETNYVFETPVEDDYEGSDLDFGAQRSSDDSAEPALHILATVTQAWRWLDITQGYDIPYVEINWPDGSGTSWYICFTEEMHITSTDQWREYPILHEFGHHWTCNYGIDQTPDYCNDICDEDPSWPFPDCGHCVWCGETDHDAWQEGFANWYGEHSTGALNLFTGQAPLFTRRFENPGSCTDVNGDPCDCDPIITEGWLTDVLHDIEDVTQDDATAWPGSDELSQGADEIFAIADERSIHTPMEFLIEYRDTYPAQKEALWATARDNGYELDLEAPGAVSGLTSPSHPLFSTSTDATPEFTWTAATDDCSGIGGYAFSFSAGGPAEPPTTLNLTATTGLVGPTLAPGTWYFNLRAIDRAGRASANWRTYGWFTIREPEAVDLQYRLPLGWAGVLVPRPDATAAVDDVPAPASLNGNVAATWWNVPGENSGEAATTSSFSVQLLVDGATAASTSVGVMGAGGTFTRINRGPVTVRGGRHTFETLLDAGEVIAETNEGDNRWAEQWIWSPLMLAPGTVVTRAAPPDLTAGWSAIGPGPALWYNCDGLRLDLSGWWNAVWVHAVDNAVDYDCRLHVSSDNPDQGGGGFGANEGWSGRSAGLLDAVFANRNVTGDGSRDIGVIDGPSGRTSQYRAEHVTSQVQTFGTSPVVSLPAGEMMALREVYVGGSNLGWIDVLVDVAPATAGVHVLWLERTFSTGDISDASLSATTDDAGHAGLSTNAIIAGYYCIVVYRDPGNDATSAAIDVTVATRRTLPDFRPYLTAGWYAPLVPRPAADANGGSAPEPLALDGNVASTWLNVCAANDSPTGSASTLEGRVFLEDSWLVSVSHGALAGYQVSRVVNAGPCNVRGGRRTLGVRLDPDHGIPEANDENNAYAEQWVWSPLPVALDAPLVRSAPPLRTGGFDYVTTGGPLYYNCDGLRTPVFAPAGADGYWGAVAVMPGPGSNVDLRLHPLSTGAGNGFAANLAGSYWGAGRSDFVIANFNETSFTDFDAGVVGVSGTENYTAEVVRSRHLGIEPSGDFGPFILAGGRIVHLYEAWLEPGTVLCRVENVSGTVDWGLCIHPGDDAWFGKSETLAGGGAWQAPGGENESVIVQPSTAGYYAITVWKARSADLSAAGTYRLVFHDGLSGTPPGVTSPTRTRIASVSPNPCNPRATVVLELAHGGRARVRVYDLRGAVVADLLDRELPAGRHEVAWPGTEDNGRPVASGVYAVSLEADGVREIRRLALVR